MPNSSTISLNPFVFVPILLRYAIALVIAVAFFVVSFLRGQWDSYTPLGQFLYVLALFAIAIDAAVAYQYGVSMTTLHAWGFAVVAIAFCVLPDVAFEAARGKNYTGAVGVGLASMLLGAVAFQSHLGYGGGVRLKEMQQTGFQHTRADDVRKVANNEAENLKTWRESLASKRAELASLKEAAGFVTSVNADGLVAELKTLTERMAAEESGKRGRKAGRGKEFEGLQNRANVIAKQLDAVKRFNGLSDEVASLETQIRQTSAIVDAKVQKVADTGYVSNTIVNQNDIAASIVNFWRGVPADDAIKPTEVQRVVASTVITGFNSLGFLICGPILQIAAGLNRRRSVLRRRDEDESGAPEGADKSTVPTDSLSDKYGHMFATKYGVAA